MCAFDRGKFLRGARIVRRKASCGGKIVLCFGQVTAAGREFSQAYGGRRSPSWQTVRSFERVACLLLVPHPVVRDAEVIGGFGIGGVTSANLLKRADCSFVMEQSGREPAGGLQSLVAGREFLKQVC